MSAPPWPPRFVNAILDPEAALDPAEEVPALIADILRDARLFPAWLAEDLGIEVRLRAASAAGTVLFEAGPLDGAITLSLDPSGWLLAVVAVGGREMFRGYLDRPYEELEIWPPGSSGPNLEAPGRMGRKHSWLSLDAAAWPALAPIANRGGWLNIRVDQG